MPNNMSNSTLRLIRILCAGVLILAALLAIAGIVAKTPSNIYLGLLAAAISLLVLYKVPSRNIASTIYLKSWACVFDRVYTKLDKDEWSKWTSEDRVPDGSMKDAIKATNEMLASLGDPFTLLYSPEETELFQNRRQGRSNGIGITYSASTELDGNIKLGNGAPLPQTDANGNLLVKSVLDGTPAHKAGLRPGDSIARIDGVSTAGLNGEAIYDALDGKIGDTVVLSIVREGAEIQVPVTHNEVHKPNISIQTYGQVGYIRCRSFAPNNYFDDLSQALESLSASQSLILDMRYNGGGQLMNAINSSSLFLDHGRVTELRQREQSSGYIKRTYDLSATEFLIRTKDEANRSSSLRYFRQPNLSDNKPVIIIVNEHSASATELFVGALQDNHRAKVVGVNTFGKGVGQSFESMPGGALLSMTDMRCFTPSGHWIGDGHDHKPGITPDFIVKLDDDAVIGDVLTDQQLSTALELLGVQKSEALKSRQIPTYQI